MKKQQSPHTSLCRPVLASALTGLALSAWVAQATPYASCLTNSSGVISFRLNEAADNVKVVTNGVPIDLGARPVGLTVTNLGITGDYQVVVKKTSASAWTQISSDANTYCKYNSPRGVTVNARPGSPYFGRVYVANSAAGTALSRTCGDGIYMINSDLTDAIGNANTAATAGVDFTQSTSDPYKICIGVDDSLYINDFSTAQANTWRTDPNVSAGSAQQILAGIGENVNTTVHTDSAGTPVVLGTLAGGDLVLYNIEGAYAGGFNRIARWDINSGPLPWNTAPTLLGWTDHSPNNLGVADLNTDMCRGPDGKFYTIIYRANDDTGNLKVFDTDANTILWTSKTSPGAVNSTLLLTRAVAVSPLGNKVAVMFDDNHVDVLTLTNGIPDWSTLTALNFTGTTVGRAMSFDAAGNIYTVSSGMTLLRAFSPGGATVATTSSTGTFSVSDLSTNVSVLPSTPTAYEAGPADGVFTISRTGDTSSSLTVNFTITGTATFGVDYILSATNSVTLAPGQAATNVIVHPIDDSIPELSESVIMTLGTGTGYYLVNPSAGTVAIVDNETPDITISAVYTNMYERVANDFVQFQLTRRGLTNDAINVNIGYGGRAINGADFSDPSGAVVTLGAGAVTTTFKLNPIDDPMLDGNRSIIASIAAAPAGEYLSNAVNYAASAVITDDEIGPVDPSDVLFSENFDNPYPANTLPATWTNLFAANNNVTDYNFTFGYDYSADSIPAPPNTFTYQGLKVTVNKDTTASAAGINFYPLGQSFSGNFAMRFNMLLVIDSSSNQTEYATFGINHSGTKTNWWRDNTGGGGIGNARAVNTDGLFFGVNSSGGDVTDYALRTQGTGAATNPAIVISLANSTTQQTFKNPPYSVLGEPGIARTAAGALTTPTWVDVEVTQIGNMRTLRLNNTIILQTTNASAFNSGNVMLGYVDPYDSIGGFYPGYVLYDNLSVVRIYPLSIVTQPVSSVVIAAGASTNLTIVTTGSATGVTNYQWQYNGVAIPNETNATLNLPTVQPSNDGVYTVVVTDGVTTLTSNPTTLLVLTPGVVVGTGTGLQAGYWTLHTNTAPYTGSATLTRVDASVNFDWVTGSPSGSISTDWFTTRWVGQVQALGSETYTFTTITDDGVRLWVNGQLLVDSWVGQSVTAHSGQIALAGAKKYDLVMEYYEQTGNAVAKLYWSNATTVGYSPVPQSQLYPGVAVSPAIVLTSPANAASYVTPATIPLAASVTTNNNLVQYVAFYNGATLLANVTNTPFQYSWTGVAPGSYNLSAKVVYNALWPLSSATNAVTVVNLTAPTISGISGGNLNYSGGAGSQFVLIKATDLTQPRTSWTRVQTNYTSSGSFPIPVGSEAQAFYTIKSE